MVKVNVFRLLVEYLNLVDGLREELTPLLAFLHMNIAQRHTSGFVDGYALADGRKHAQVRQVLTALLGVKLEPPVHV